MRCSRRALLAQAGALGMLGTSGIAMTARANALRLGQTAPAATLVALDGRRYSTPELVGTVVILTFLATWCEPCRQELPLLAQYLRTNQQKGLTILGFSLDTNETLPDLRKMVADLGFPVGLLSASSAPGYGRIWRLPVSFTIDRAGRLVDDGWKDRPPVWTREHLERIVDPLLGSQTRLSACVRGGYQESVDGGAATVRADARGCAVR